MEGDDDTSEMSTVIRQTQDYHHLRSAYRAVPVEDDYNAHSTIVEDGDIECAAKDLVEVLSKFMSARISQSFVKELGGFYLGSLDLSGRHRPRYEKMRAKWDTFVEGLDAVSLSVPGFEFRKPETWKTKLSQDEDGRLMAVLLGAIDNIVRTMSIRLPVFQTLCLHDLPSELLHMIVDNLDQEGARALASTARLFRAIAQSFLYRHTSFQFKWLDYDALPKPTGTQSRQLAARTAMFATRAVTLEHMQFVFQNSSHLTAMLSLYVGGGFLLDDLATAGVVESDDRRNFFSPMADVLSSIIKSAPNVRSIRILNWDITRDIATAILSMRSLRDVSFVASLTLDNIAPPATASPIVNLDITIANQDNLPVWEMLAHTPDLQFLCVRSSYDTPSLVFPDILLVNNPFKTVKRFMGTNLFVEDVETLAQWILDARGLSEDRLPLTHFKLTARLQTADIWSLLTALHGTAIRCFSLEGICAVSPEILSDIGRALPRLEALSLHYLDNRQVRAGQANWPRPTWEYAAALRDFPHLKHFIWNQDTTFYFGSGAMEFLESGWPKEREDFRVKPPDFVDDWECVAKLFGVHCDSLETVTFVQRGIVDKHYTIQRSTDGRAHVDPVDVWPVSNATSDLVKRLDPCMWDSDCWSEPCPQAR